MSTKEFFRKLRRIARKHHDVALAVQRYESNGPHRRISLGNRSATVPWTEYITNATAHRILEQLGIEIDEESFLSISK